MKILHKSIRIKNKRYNEKLNKAMGKFVAVLDKYRGEGEREGAVMYVHHHHHHHQSLFIHEIVSFYMVFLGIEFKTRLKYSKELLTIMLKIQKLTL